MKKEIRRYAWKDGKTLTIGEKTLIMGILNYTPDSFSDGGKWNRIDDALRHMEEMVADGADIIDIGAESTRPGHQAITAEEEIERLRGILPKLAAACPVPISVDTYKAETAAYAVDMGAHIINDIWGLQYEAEPGQMAAVAAAKDVPVVAMHNQNGTEYTDIIGDMKACRSGTCAEQAHLRPGHRLWQDLCPKHIRHEAFARTDGPAVSDAPRPQPQAVHRRSPRLAGRRADGRDGRGLRRRRVGRLRDHAGPRCQADCPHVPHGRRAARRRRLEVIWPQGIGMRNFF